MDIESAVHSRHGIMVVGEPISGKTSAIKTFVETVDKLTKKEFNVKYVSFMQTKAERLGISIKKI